MTEITTLTLTDFLLARIDEDEEVAMRAAAATGGGYWEVRSVPYEGISISEAGRWWPKDAGSDDECDHAERHDPARVLAECEAKRRIVVIHYNGSPETDPNRCSPCDTVGDDPCPTLRALALPYADHPDYRQEWKP